MSRKKVSVKFTTHKTAPPEQPLRKKVVGRITIESPSYFEVEATRDEFYQKMKHLNGPKKCWKFRNPIYNSFQKRPFKYSWLSTIDFYDDPAFVYAKMVYGG